MLTLNQGEGQNGGSFATRLVASCEDRPNYRSIFQRFLTSRGLNENVKFDLSSLTLVRKVAQVSSLGGSSDWNKTVSDPFLDAHSGSGRSKSI